MDGIDVLRMQLLGSCDRVADQAAAVRDLWTERAFPGCSLPGFVVWHCARVVDWGVNTVVREVPEVAAASPWREGVRYEMGHGAGLSAAEADEVAASVAPDDVITYAAALRGGIEAWLAGVSPEELDRVPELRRLNAAHPRYATDAAWAEIEGLEGLSAWHVLFRPCVLHVRTHAGELETLRQALTANAAAR